MKDNSKGILVGFKIGWEKTSFCFQAFAQDRLKICQVMLLSSTDFGPTQVYRKMVFFYLQVS